MRALFLLLICLLLLCPAQAQVGKEVARGLLRAVEKSAAQEASLVRALEKATTASVRSLTPGAQDFARLGPLGTDAQHWLNQEELRFYQQGLLTDKEYARNRLLMDRYQRATYTKTAVLTRLMSTPCGKNFLNELIHSQVVKTIDYAALIAADKKIIYIGEIHNFKAIYHEVERMILQYRAKYPQRSVYLLAESIASDLPFITSGSVDIFGRLFDASVTNDAQSGLFFRLAQQGVKIGGIERPGLIRFLNSEDDLVSENARAKYSTMAMLEKRNLSFKQKIQTVHQAEPDAILFVYGGKGHFSYTYPDNVPDLVGEEKSMVIDFSFREKTEPLGSQSIWNFWKRYQQENENFLFGSIVRRVSSGKVGRLFGADVKVELELSDLKSSSF